MFNMISENLKLISFIGISGDIPHTTICE